VGVKYLLKLKGIGTGEVRLPMVKASNQLRVKIDKVYKQPI
jgi:dihydrodipicolinate synthase/N-acetylneuraminate lyase